MQLLILENVMGSRLTLYTLRAGDGKIGGTTIPEGRVSRQSQGVIEIVILILEITILRKVFLFWS